MPIGLIMALGVGPARARRPVILEEHDAHRVGDRMQSAELGAADTGGDRHELPGRRPAQSTSVSRNEPRRGIASPETVAPMRTKRIARTSPGSRRRRGRQYPKPELAKLHRVDRRRRVGHRLLCLLVLGEGDDVADVVGAEPFHDHPVDAARPPAVGGAPVLECLEQEAELACASSASMPRAARPVLDRRVGDADAAAADLATVDDEVVRARADRGAGRNSSRSRSSAWTIVKGWCAAPISPVSSLRSNIGNSVTQSMSMRVIVVELAACVRGGCAVHPSAALTTAGTVRDHEHAVPDPAPVRADRVQLLGGEELGDATLPAVGPLPRVGEPRALPARATSVSWPSMSPRVRSSPPVTRDSPDDAARRHRVGEHAETARCLTISVRSQQQHREASIGLATP